MGGVASVAGFIIGGFTKSGEMIGYPVIVDDTNQGLYTVLLGS